MLADDLRSEPWMLEAACFGYPTDWWFPAKGDMATIRRAKEICGRCPVMEECGEYGLEHAGKLGRQGIWGGRSINRRKRSG